MNFFSGLSDQYLVSRKKVLDDLIEKFEEERRELREEFEARQAITADEIQHEAEFRYGNHKWTVRAVSRSDSKAEWGVQLESGWVRTGFACRDDVAAFLNANHCKRA